VVGDAYEKYDVTALGLEMGGIRKEIRFRLESPNFIDYPTPMYVCVSIVKLTFKF
jgi:hypothetical protein